MNVEQDLVSMEHPLSSEEATFVENQGVTVEQVYQVLQAGGPMSLVAAVGGAMNIRDNLAKGETPATLQVVEELPVLDAPLDPTPEVHTTE